MGYVILARLCDVCRVLFKRCHVLAHRVEAWQIALAVYLAGIAATWSMLRDNGCGHSYLCARTQISGGRRLTRYTQYSVKVREMRCFDKFCANQNNKFGS